MSQSTKEVIEGGLVQISTRTLNAKRVPHGEDPVFETQLRADQEIVSFTHGVAWGSRERKTEDHFATLWIATRPGDSDAS